MSIGILLGIYLIFQKELTYPQYVYNKCTGLWAVKLRYMEGEPQYYGETVETWWAQRAGYHGELHTDHDTGTVSAGYEFTFKSKQEAINSYRGFARRYNADIAYRDSVDGIVTKKRDSIFNCQHGYK